MGEQGVVLSLPSQEGRLGIWKERLWEKGRGQRSGCRMKKEGGDERERDEERERERERGGKEGMKEEGTKEGERNKAMEKRERRKKEERRRKERWKGNTK